MVRDDEMATHGQVVLVNDLQLLNSRVVAAQVVAHRVGQTVGGEEQAQCAVDLLRAGYERFQLLRKSVAEGEPLAEYYHRSVFRLVSVQQVVSYLEAHEWKADARLTPWVLRKYKAFMQSQLAEDAFTVCRKVETRNLNKVAKPGALYAAVASERVMAKRHNYHEVEPKMHEEPFGKGLSVPDDFWRFRKGKEDPADLPLREISGFSEKTPWYTCTPERFAVQHADLELFALLKHLEGWAEWSKSLQKTWLGCFLNAPILIRRVVPRLPTPWCFAIGDIFGTASIVVPAREVRVGESNDQRFFVPDLGSSIKFEAITNLDHSEGRCRQLGNMPSSRASGHRAYLSSRRCGLWRQASPSICSSSHRRTTSGTSRSPSFRSWPTSSASKASGRTRLSSRPCSRWCPRAWAARRFSRDSRFCASSKAKFCTMFSSALNACACLTACCSSRSHIWTPSPSHMASTAQGSSRRHSRAIRCLTTSKASREKCEAKLSVPTSTIEQEKARKLCPPGSYVRRNLRDGGWAGHFAPYRRVSALWAVHGELGAMLHVLRLLWLQYLQHHGLPHSSCSVAGLLDAGAAQPAQRASGVASSFGA